jgi:hypothetical protein
VTVSWRIHLQHHSIPRLQATRLTEISPISNLVLPHPLLRMMYKISQSSVMQKMSNTNKPEIREFVYNSSVKSLFRLSEIQLVGATTVMLLNPSKICLLAITGIPQESYNGQKAMIVPELQRSLEKRRVIPRTHNQQSPQIW